MRRKVLPVVVAGMILSSSMGAWAAGFALYEGSARGNAMGGGLTGLADDPSALFFNPAGITQLEGFQSMVGATFIGPSVDVKTLTPQGWVRTKAKDKTWIPPHVYATYQMNDKVWLGFGAYSRFGLGSSFDENWPGRYNNYNAVIKTLSLNPNVAVKATDKLSLAAGASAMWFDLKLQRKVPNPLMPQMDGTFTLEGDSWGYGFNLAARYEFTKWMAAGLAYQSQVKQSIDGNADIQISSTGAKGDVTLPDMLFSGLAFKPLEQLKVEVGAVYTGWGSYDELRIALNEPAKIGATQKESATPKNWDDVMRYQFGMEYSLNKTVDLRAGYVYDQTPDPDATADYLVPSNSRDIYSLGAGFHVQNWTLDLSYNYLVIRDREWDARLQQGVLQTEIRNGDAHMFGISVSTKI